MVQGRGGASLALEAIQRARILLCFRGKELEGHMPAQVQVLGLIHHTHASATQLREHAVVGDSLPDHTGNNSWVRINRC